MDRRQLSHLAHRDHPVAAPLDDTSVGRLLTLALPRGDGRVLDLGCGEAAWLLRALTGRPEVRGTGVDVSPVALAGAREAAAAVGLTERLTLHETDAARFTAPHAFDLVAVVGATHAFGGLLPALTAARAHLAPGGRVLVGEGFWECAPSPAALAGLGASAGEFDDLATTVDRVTADGWTPVHAHVSTPGEWDDYEWSWTGSLSRWALDNPHHPDSADAQGRVREVASSPCWAGRGRGVWCVRSQGGGGERRVLRRRSTTQRACVPDPAHQTGLPGHAPEAAAAHRQGWLRGYRGTLGFVTLLLRAA